MIFISGESIPSTKKSTSPNTEFTTTQPTNNYEIVSNDSVSQLNTTTMILTEKQSTTTHGQWSDSIIKISTLQLDDEKSTNNATKSTNLTQNPTKQNIISQSKPITEQTVKTTSNKHIKTIQSTEEARSNYTSGHQNKSTLPGMLYTGLTGCNYI